MEDELNVFFWKPEEDTKIFRYSSRLNSRILQVGFENPVESIEAIPKKNFTQNPPKKKITSNNGVHHKNLVTWENRAPKD